MIELIPRPKGRPVQCNRSIRNSSTFIGQFQAIKKSGWLVPDPVIRTKDRQDHMLKA
jgi:hypothetical protein